MDCNATGAHGSLGTTYAKSPAKETARNAPGLHILSLNPLVTILSFVFRPTNYWCRVCALPSCGDWKGSSTGNFFPGWITL